MRQKLVENFRVFFLSFLVFNYHLKIRIHDFLRQSIVFSLILSRAAAVPGDDTENKKIKQILYEYKSKTS